MTSGSKCLHSLLSPPLNLKPDVFLLPLVQSSHIHLIDALMMAYTVEMISIEKVVSSVKRFSTFTPSKELPFDLEDAMVFWINKVRTKCLCVCLNYFMFALTCSIFVAKKVNVKLREISEKALKMKQHLLDSPGHQKVTHWGCL